MAASLLSHAPAKVAPTPPLPKRPAQTAAAGRLPELSGRELDKLFDQAQRLEPKRPNKPQNN